MPIHIKVQNHKSIDTRLVSTRQLKIIKSQIEIEIAQREQDDKQQELMDEEDHETL